MATKVASPRYSKKARARSVNDPLDVVEFAELLTPHARVKDCLWDWEFARYSKDRRSQGPD
eukprot:9848741-Lingulodinium_polyedra.AAC.1